jgi:hypothetical protein
MGTGVLRVNDIDPDGVRIVIRWDELVPSSSIFVPCINTEEARHQLRRIAEKLGYKTQSRAVIENGRLGVRLWRLPKSVPQ